MTNRRRIYVLEGKSEEDICMAMAMASRSPKPFDENLAGIDEARSSGFLYKFYITYGHGSIADSAFIHLALENVTSLACKVIEDSRLAAYQEKSSRYQIFDRKNIFIPKEIKKSKYLKLYKDTVNLLFDHYEELISLLMEQAKKENPKKNEETDREHEHRIRIPVIDQCRFLLPLCVYRNVGTTMSARTLEYAIAKMYSHSLSEIRDIAKEMHYVAQKRLPTLVKHAEPSDYLKQTEHNMRRLGNEIVGKEYSDLPQKPIHTELVEYDKNALDRVVTALLFRFSGKSIIEIKEKVKKMKEKEKERIFDQAFGKREHRFDKPLRELETTNYTFEITGDFGVYYDLGRHRMCTQSNQILSTKTGYVIPDKVKEIGYQKKYINLMRVVDKNYSLIAKSMPFEAQYLTTFAHRKRTIFHLNLREAIYLIELRTRELGHISYRRAAYQMYQQIAKVHPYFAKHIQVTKKGLE